MIILIFFNFLARYPSVQQMIVNVIKRFKFEDLESSVMPIFPELSWTDVRSKLVKNHKNFTSFNVAQIIKIVITVSFVHKYVMILPILFIVILLYIIFFILFVLGS